VSIDRERLGSGYLPPWVIHEHQARWRFAADYVAGRDVIDCACGVGRGTALFAAAGAASVRAFDLDAGAVDQTIIRTAGMAGVSAVAASGLDLPVPERSADVFISLETIEHLDDAAGLVAEYARVLRPDGVLICSTPNRTVTMPGRALDDQPWNPFHVREYDRSEFAALLGERFETLEWFGQNRRSAPRVMTMAAVGGVLPGNIGGRIGSALKLPRLAFDRERFHRVRPIGPEAHTEYHVVVARNPRR
jgi:SAM-dependent methyltransferase